ncbi:MAG TPA: hypothetical protein VHZ24_14360 [Pirellulales bacterium]|jgi:adenosylhomocysteine nucleosidase|nr:hypothetical protein [Pirellulales bacterium]
MVWQAFVRSWLQQQVRSKLAEQLREQAAGGAAQAADDPAETIACDVGVVFALGIELGGFEDLLSGVRVTRTRGCIVRRGTLAGRGVAVVETGIGREHAARGTEVLIAGHRPRWIVSAGFAGGLVEKLSRGDVVMANEIASPAGPRLAVDLRVDPASLATTPGVHVGRLLTVDSIVAEPEAKRALARQHEAIAVDMESWHVAEACRQARTRFLCVRVISDPVDEALPADVLRLANQTNVASRLGAATGALWRRPGSIKDMWRLKENALVCSDRLAKFLAEMVAQLPPERGAIESGDPG